MSARATEVLSAEHQIILKALDLLEAVAERLFRGDRAAEQDARDLLDYLISFADGIHHGKEEAMLFPALSDAGMPMSGGPVHVMLAEHDRGRGLLRRIGEELSRGLPDERAREAFADAAVGYVHLMRDHIEKEDEVLFPMADHLLDEGMQERLSAAFEAHGGQNEDQRRRCEAVLARVRRSEEAGR